MAARVGDKTGHPGVIAGPGETTVLIGGVPAAVQGTLHTCEMPPKAGPHAPSPIAQGSSTVFARGRGIARVGDTAGCGAPIIAGDSTVLIGD